MNRFRLHARSAVISGTAAGAAIAAWRNAHSSMVQYLESVQASWRTIQGPTSAEQEVQIEVAPVVSGMSSNATGGSDLSDYTGGSPVLATNAIRPLSKVLNDPSASDPRSLLESGNVRISSGAALTVGSGTIATHGWCSAGHQELLHAATVRRGRADAWWFASSDSDYESMQRLNQDTGFVVRLPIALGTGLTGRLYLTVTFRERL